MSWERRHSPLTREGGLEDVGRFADGLRQAGRSSGQRRRVRQFGLVVITSVVAIVVIVVIGGLVAG